MSYKMVHAVVGLVNNSEGKVLLGLKKAYDSPLSGKWHVPGGKVKVGESDTDALIRELFEETHLDVRVGVFLGRMVVPGSDSTVSWYECFLVHPQQMVVPDSDLSDAVWVDKSEVVRRCLPRSLEYWPKMVLEYLS